jgi:hypothetical protein
MISHGFFGVTWGFPPAILCVTESLFGSRAWTVINRRTSRCEYLRVVEIQKIGSMRITLSVDVSL